MTVDVQWNADHGVFQVMFPQGTPDEVVRAAWKVHQVAAIGEGFCPSCAGRLIPYTSDVGPVQRCPGRHGWWQLDHGEQRLSWWIGRTPDGSPIGPANAWPVAG